MARVLPDGLREWRSAAHVLAQPLQIDDMADQVFVGGVAAQAAVLRQDGFQSRVDALLQNVHLAFERGFLVRLCHKLLELQAEVVDERKQGRNLGAGSGGVPGLLANPVEVVEYIHGRIPRRVFAVAAQRTVDPVDVAEDRCRFLLPVDLPVGEICRQQGDSRGQGDEHDQSGKAPADLFTELAVGEEFHSDSAGGRWRAEIRGGAFRQTLRNLAIRFGKGKELGKGIEPQVGNVRRGRQVEIEGDVFAS